MQANSFLLDVESKVNKIGSPTYIGVHGRFTDYPEYMNKVSQH